MNKEVSLPELVDRLQTEDKRDYAVPASHMTIGSKSTDKHSSLHVNGLPAMPMTTHANAQLNVSLAKGLKSFADDMKATGREDIYLDAVNELLERKQNRRYRLRTIDKHNEQTARALVSPRYKVIDDDVIFGTALPRINQSDQFKALGGKKTDTRTVMKFIEKEPSISIRSSNRVRDYSFGFILGNSEVGAGSTKFEMFMSDGFCMNGCIFSKEVLASINYKHIGTAFKNSFGILSPDNIAHAETASIKRMIVDATEKSMDINKRSQLIHTIQQAADRQITGDVGEVLKRLGKQTGLRKKEIEELPLKMQSDELTQLGLQAAVTSLAQDKPYERRLELESIGGSTLMMNDREWARIAA